MDIPINAKVYCQDKLCGFAQGVILNPENDVVTHVVVKESKNSHAERLVPIDMIDASLADNIHLKLDTAMLQNLPPLYDVEYVQTTVPHLIELSDMAYMKPVVVPEKKFIEEKIYHIPMFGTWNCWRKSRNPKNHSKEIYRRKNLPHPHE